MIVKRFCLNCKKEFNFELRPSSFLRHKGKFCSAKCRSSYYCKKIKLWNNVRGKKAWNNKQIEVNCSGCGKKILISPSRLKLYKFHSCSRKCHGVTAKKWGFGLDGENNSEWKGDKVSYVGLHQWVKRHLGKPNKCEMCKKNKNKYHWANKSGKYKRDLEDWISLCVSCHKKYDSRLDL